MPLPLVAIVGRPNVGKSTLFNRLANRRDAIVTDIPGTTRDRLLAEVAWNDSRFILVDTGGLEPYPQDVLRDQVKAQVEAAVDQADLIIFLVDVEDGVVPMDLEIAGWLRQRQKPLVLAVNKVDNQKRRASAAEFEQIGLSEPVQISAYHNLGIYDLMDQVVPTIGVSPEETEDAPEGMSLSIVGRPNVGKSMLVNAILGEERAIVSEIPGTTRDALDTPFLYEDKPVVLVDTAGIRRPGRIGRSIEFYSVLRAMRAVQRSDIALLVMDATELATAQDAHILGDVWDEYKGIIVVVNKWDLVPKEDPGEREIAVQTIRQRFHFMPYAPITFTSATMGQGLGELMDLAFEVYGERTRRVPASRLNHALMDALGDHMPPARKGKSLRIGDIRQVDINPPTFLVKVNNPKLVHFSYHRYLENRLRATLGFTHTHLRLVFKGRM
ncbi:MAG: ribosome biogenesis GTPase Der [Dehalococcoidia bacterium]|nr:ribosome biogenesis GTPase Der [Dehalococcoidia bacterium]